VAVESDYVCIGFFEGPHGQLSCHEGFGGSANKIKYLNKSTNSYIIYWKKDLQIAILTEISIPCLSPLERSRTSGDALQGNSPSPTVITRAIVNKKQSLTGAMLPCMLRSSAIPIRVNEIQENTEKATAGEDQNTAID
jgi:hypothetical protein